eukprot:50139-Eustigmatos_ZCMA.PRE.1
MPSFTAWLAPARMDPRTPYVPMLDAGAVWAWNALGSVEVVEVDVLAEDSRYFNRSSSFSTVSAKSCSMVSSWLQGTVSACRHASPGSDVCSCRQQDDGIFSVALG